MNAKQNRDPESVVREIRRQYSAEEKIQIVLEGLKGKSASRSYAVVKGLSAICIIAGVRTF